LASNIEAWVQQMLAEGKQDGWKPMVYNKMVSITFNGGERTTVCIKWIKESCTNKANKQDSVDFPCIKCCLTIDMPLEDVCTYLS
jgi:hypothetical protein